MNFIIHSTLIVVTGLSVIAMWLLVGYVVTRIWWYFLQEKLQFTKKTVFGIVSGPITILYLAGTALLNLIPDHS